MLLGFDNIDHRRVPNYQLEDIEVQNQDPETTSKETTEKGKYYTRSQILRFVKHKRLVDIKPDNICGHVIDN